MQLEEPHREDEDDWYGRRQPDVSRAEEQKDAGRRHSEHACRIRSEGPADVTADRVLDARRHATERARNTGERPQRARCAGVAR